MNDRTITSYLEMPAGIEEELPKGVLRELLFEEVAHAFENDDLDGSTFVGAFLTLVSEGYSVATSWWLVREGAIRAAISSVK